MRFMNQRCGCKFIFTFRKALIYRLLQTQYNGMRRYTHVQKNIFAVNCGQLRLVLKKEQREPSSGFRKQRQAQVIQTAKNILLWFLLALTKRKRKKKTRGECSYYIFHVCSESFLLHPPVVLIMLFGVAEAAAKILGVLELESPGEVLVLLDPSVLTAKLPVEVFFTGTTTLLQKTQGMCIIHTHR